MPAAPIYRPGERIDGPSVDTSVVRQHYFMKGPPDTPTIHLGVRRPEQALPKIWNICYNQGYGCAAHQTRHL
jgi:hypothetical protein